MLKYGLQTTWKCLVTEHNPDKTAEISTSKGYTKDRTGFWVDADGNTTDLTIEAAAPWPEQKKMGMIIAEQLVRAGFDAKVRVMEWTAMSEKFWTGESDMWPHWSVAGVAEPYAFMDWYHSKWVKPSESG